MEAAPNGHAFTVLDSAGNILDSGAASGVTAYKLNADALDLSVANATTLTGLTGFDLNEHYIGVRDTALHFAAADGTPGTGVPDMLPYLEAVAFTDPVNVAQASAVYAIFDAMLFAFEEGMSDTALHFAAADGTLTAGVEGLLVTSDVTSDGTHLVGWPTVEFTDAATI